MTREAKVKTNRGPSLSCVPERTRPIDEEPVTPRERLRAASICGGRVDAGVDRLGGSMRGAEDSGSSVGRVNRRCPCRPARDQRPRVVGIRG